MNKGYSPYCMYIPSKRVIFKMMRASIGCYSKQDLWFNQGVEEEEENERIFKI